MKDCEKAIELKKDYSKAYYRRAVCYMNMKMFQKSWNDLMYILRDAPASKEILGEIKTTKDKWRLNLGNEEFSKIEKKLDNDIEQFKKFVGQNFNKNDEKEAQPIPSTNSSEKKVYKKIKKTIIYPEEEGDFESDVPP